VVIVDEMLREVLKFKEVHFGAHLFKEDCRTVKNRSLASPIQ
jgi:hypothetical protein